MMTKTIDTKDYNIKSNHKMEEVVQSIYCLDFIFDGVIHFSSL